MSIGEYNWQHCGHLEARGEADTEGDGTHSEGHMQNLWWSRKTEDSCVHVQLLYSIYICTSIGGGNEGHQGHVPPFSLGRYSKYTSDYI